MDFTSNKTMGLKFPMTLIWLPTSNNNINRISFNFILFNSLVNIYIGNSNEIFERN